MTHTQLAPKQNLAKTHSAKSLQPNKSQQSEAALSGRQLIKNRVEQWCDRAYPD